MTRATTADHILFDECINAFRSEGSYNHSPGEGSSHSYILLSFKLSKEWQLPNCTVRPTKNVEFPGPYSAFICSVNLPNSADANYAHLYGIALSSIITFATGRLCKSIRKKHSRQGDTLTENQVIAIALTYPVLSSGPGCETTILPEDTQKKYNDDISYIIKKLHTIPYQKYIILMQAIRLIHLSLSNKRDDFGLAYLLIISAIESVAQHAITRDKVKQKHLDESLWSKRARSDEDFLRLLAAYKEARGQKKYLKERYVKFINTFAPTSVWEEIIPHPLQDIVDNYKNDLPYSHLDHITEKQLHEVYPSDLTAQQVNTILSDSYSHRSCYIHRGKQPPHQEPTHYDRFFEKHIEIKESSKITKLLPNYELLAGVAQHAIRKWMDSI